MGMWCVAHVYIAPAVPAIQVDMTVCIAWMQWLTSQLDTLHQFLSYFNGTPWEMIKVYHFLHWHHQTLFSLNQLSKFHMKAFRIWRENYKNMIKFYIESHLHILMIITEDYDHKWSPFAYLLKVMMKIMINFHAFPL